MKYSPLRAGDVEFELLELMRFFTRIFFPFFAFEFALDGDGESEASTLTSAAALLPLPLSMLQRSRFRGGDVESP